jgi:hypothetical protein
VNWLLWHNFSEFRAWRFKNRGQKVHMVGPSLGEAKDIMSSMGTDREKKGGVLLPVKIDDKTGEQVIDILQSKHPDVQVPEASKMEDYDTLPNFVDLDITKISHRESSSTACLVAVRVWEDLIHKPYSSGCYNSCKPVKDSVRQCVSLQTGWPMICRFGQHIVLSKLGDLLL